MTSARTAGGVPSVIERFLKALVVTRKAVALYPPASNVPLDTAKDAARALRMALGEKPELRLSVTKGGLYHAGEQVFPNDSAYGAFALDLYSRRVSEIRFHSGTSARDLVAFLSLLKSTSKQIESAGGFSCRLWDLGVGTITVTDLCVTVVEDVEAETGAACPGAPLSKDAVDALLAAAYENPARDRLELTRFVGDPQSVATYIGSTFEHAAPHGLREAGERFSQLAGLAAESKDAEERLEHLKSLGEALLSLDPGLRRDLLVDAVLPEARTNEALASIVQQFDTDRVLHMLLDEMNESEASFEGIARAIRTLATLSLAGREEVLEAAGSALRGAGMSDEATAGILEAASPSRLEVKPAGTRQETGGSAEVIRRLVNMAPLAEAIDEDPDVAALREEARRGVSDGDVIMALVTIATLECSPEEFASTMMVLEDALDAMIGRGDLVVAADAAEALMAASERTDLAPAQRQRLHSAVGRFTRAEDVGEIAHAVRLYEPDAPEHVAARRLLDTLGPLAIEPMLEQLADEPDMGARKSIVDMLSELAPGHVQEIGSHVNDQRWYVVRNVVAILASTHSSAVLPYLERTVRHPDPRVRRESIRAAAGINDRLATEILLSCLRDEDAQNVQLAARYLGAAGARGAVPLLEQVARGEGRGNRDTGPRVEAIEALGRLGAREAIPTLEALAGRRRVGAGRGREIRASAESALERIRATGGGS